MSWGVKGFCRCGVQFAKDNCPASVLDKGRGLCRKCNSLRMKLWSEKNPNKSKTYKRNRREIKPEEIRKYDNDYYHNVLKNDSEFKGKKAAYHVKRSSSDPEFKLKTTAYQRKLKYGMTTDDFDALLVCQGNRCAICRKSFDKTPHVDHCHITERNRGLLCGTCNRGLGMFFDSPEMLLSAVDYLKKYKN